MYETVEDIKNSPQTKMLESLILNSPLADWVAEERAQQEMIDFMLSQIKSKYNVSSDKEAYKLWGRFKEDEKIFINV